MILDGSAVERLYLNWSVLEGLWRFAGSPKADAGINKPRMDNFRKRAINNAAAMSTNNTMRIVGEKLLGIEDVAENTF